MLFKELFFVVLALLLYTIQASEAETVRVRRALFNTGKFLMPKPQPKPTPPVIEFRKYPAAASGETLFKPRPFYPPIFFPLRRRPIRNQIFKREGARHIQSPPIQPPPGEQIFQHQIGGEIGDSWAQAQRQARFPSTEVDDTLNEVDGQLAGHKRDCTRIPDGAAELLCNYIKEDTENDEAEFLWVPLTTPLVGYPVNTRLERWFQKGCFNWKLKTCSGIPRYPLASKCRFWSPEPVAIPGCPQITKEQEVSWKDYPPNHCPCKWPCTKLFESIQECYQMPNATSVDAAVDKASTPTPKQKPISLRLSSGQAFQLCRAADKGVIHGQSVSVSWIPIPLGMKRQQQQRGAQCSNYVFRPCLGGHNDKEGCGKWRKEAGTCEGNDGIDQPRARGSSMGTASCPCQLPCIRFFDAINKCDEPSFSRSGGGEADPSTAVSLLLRDVPREETDSSLVECNMYDKEMFCTIIPPEDQMEGNRVVGLDTDQSPGIRRHGRVKCEHVDSKPVCLFVYD